MPFSLAQCIEQLDLKALKSEMNKYSSRADRLAQYEGWLSEAKTPEDHEMLEDLYYIAEKLPTELCQRWQNVIQSTREEIARRGLRILPWVPEKLVIGYLKEATPELAKNPPPPAYFTAWCMFLAGIR